MRYFFATALILSGFAWAESRGVGLVSSGQHHPAPPASVRTSPGGYRSYHFWHTGFHGGK
jgi:hypothetical protein